MMKNEGSMYFYADLYRYRFILYALIGFFVISFWASESLYDEIYTVIKALSILISISALLFITYCNNYIKDKGLSMLQLGLFSITLLLLFKFLSFSDISLFGRLDNVKTVGVLDNEYFTGIFYLLIFYMISAYKKLSNKKIASVVCALLAVILFIRILFSYDIIDFNRAIVSMFLVRMFCIFLCLKLSVKQKIKYNNEINFFLILLVAEAFMTIIDSQVYLISEKYTSCIFLVTALVRISFGLVYVVSACEKLINNTYEDIFNDTIEVNKILRIKNAILENKTIELEKTKQDLKEEELLYKEFLKLVPIPFIILNIDNNRISYCNRSFKNLVGKEARDIVNNVVDNIINIEYDDLRDLRLGINKIYRGTIEFGSISKDLNVMPLAQQQSENSVILLVEDVTEKRKIEKIKSAIIDKEINEKIKKDFLSNISHDLKTPINVISSAAQLNNVYAKAENKDSILEYIKISKQNLKTLIHLTDNLMKFEGEAKVHLSPNITESNVVEFLDDKVSSLVKYAETKGIKMELIKESNEIRLKYDKDFLERILLNLISNAMKFTSRGGSVRVRVYTDNDDVCIDVEDSGRGMKQQFIETAFEKYSMQYEIDDNSKDGSGIGLFVVYSLMRLQGGNVNVKSEEGKGTKFTLVFKRG